MGDCCHCVFFIKVVKDKNAYSIPKYGLFYPGISWRYIHIYFIYKYFIYTHIYIITYITFYNIILK